GAGCCEAPVSDDRDRPAAAGAGLHQDHLLRSGRRGELLLTSQNPHQCGGAVTQPRGAFEGPAGGERVDVREEIAQRAGVVPGDQAIPRPRPRGRTGRSGEIFPGGPCVLRAPERAERVRALRRPRDRGAATVAGGGEPPAAPGAPGAAVVRRLERVDELLLEGPRLEE